MDVPFSPAEASEPSGAPPLNQDRPRVVLAPRAAAAALDMCRQAREAILINEEGLVRLTHLLLSLPPARPA